MGTLKKGIEDIKSVRIGDTEVKSIYIGDRKLYSPGYVSDDPSIIYDGDAPVLLDNIPEHVPTSEDLAVEEAIRIGSLRRAPQEDPPPIPEPSPEMIELADRIGRWLYGDAYTTEVETDEEDGDDAQPSA